MKAYYRSLGGFCSTDISDQADPQYQGKKYRVLPSCFYEGQVGTCINSYSAGLDTWLRLRFDHFLKHGWYVETNTVREGNIPVISDFNLSQLEETIEDGDK